MPPSPRFRSQKARERVVALLMVLLFCACVGAAYAWTQISGRALAIPELGSNPEQIDGLALKIPSTWRADAKPPDDDKIEHVRTYSDPNAKGPRLEVTTVMRPVPSLPVSAMEPVIHAALGGEPRRQISQMRPMTPFRAGALVGTTYGQLIATTTNEVRYHLWAALTRDGRRYWVLHLISTMPAPNARQERLVVLDKVFRDICNSASSATGTAATPDDYTRLGLSIADRNVVLPPNMEASVSWDDPGTIAISPIDGPGDVELYRARGTIDAGVDEPRHVLSPDALLMQWFVSVMGRTPDPTELRQRDVNGHRAWVVTLKPEEEEDGPSLALLRQVWYVRTTPGHALLLEVVTQSPRLRAAGARAAALAGTFITAMGAPPASATQPTATAPAATQPAVPGAALLAAVEQGAKLAKSLRDLAAENGSGWTYKVWEQQDRAIGLTIERRWRDETAGSNPLRGETREVQAMERGRTQARWIASPDFSTFTMQTLQAVNAGGITVPRAEQVELQRDRIVASQRVRGKMTETWSSSVPPAYLPPLPMAGEYWPLRSMKDWLATPTLIWISRGVDLPQLCLIEPSAPPSPGLDAQESVAGGTTAGVSFSVRPLASLDGDQFLLDDHGRVLTENRTLSHLAISGPVRLVLRRVERDELVQRFPRMGPELDAWEGKKDEKP
ncbi:MAG: hypothetical protein K8S99_01285 [Planctomycetes bacterium]|nr:hypothetical protein [Planctomycetota bacterium]